MGYQKNQEIAEGEANSRKSNTGCKAEAREDKDTMPR